MINHYLLTLDVEQEDRVLTQEMLPLDNLLDFMHAPCLVMLVQNVSTDSNAGVDTRCLHWPGEGRVITTYYDKLCRRFGIERINAAIRNRILANQARRTLRNAPQLETA